MQDIASKITGTVLVGAITAPPMAFPQVTIGGVSRELRFTYYSSWFLETQCNVPAHKLQAWLAEQYAAERISSTLMVMTGAMLGSVINGQWEPAPITAQELAKTVRADEWTALMNHYTEAMVKVSALMQQALTAARVEPTEPNPTTQIN